MVRLDFIPIVFGKSDWGTDPEKSWGNCTRRRDDFGQPARCQFGGVQARPIPKCFAGSQTVPSEFSQLLYAETDGEPFLSFTEAVDWSAGAANRTFGPGEVSQYRTFGPGETSWQVDSPEPCHVAENYTLFKSCLPDDCKDENGDSA